MRPHVVYEDDLLLVLVKPSGWITNEASTTGKQKVLQTWIKQNYNFETTKDKNFRDGIVHRLDKETSGVILVAKTKSVFTDLQRQFKSRLVLKEYVALVHGRVEPRKGVVNAPVGRLPWRRDRFGVLPGGREAQSSYVVQEFYQRGKMEYSLIKVSPKTGRTHQIRIHMKHLGHPVVADEFYAGRKTARNDRKWCPRLFLHAAEILVKMNGKKSTYSSSLPSDLTRALEFLQVSA